jgi:tetratricopeptide (TPR) repeat protein
MSGPHPDPTPPPGTAESDPSAVSGVNARGALGVQVGDGGWQINNFTVAGDLVVRFPGVDDGVRPPTTLDDARRMMFGSTRRAPLGRSPLRWLSADAGIVPTHPRQDVDQLLDWIGAPDGPVIRLVTGVGGQGKTVLGRLLCREAKRRGHIAGFARLPPPSWRGASLDVGGQLASLGWARQWAEVISATLASTTMTSAPVLLVVDYAENHVEAVADLLTQIVAPPDGVERVEQVRVLLLARHDHGWWFQLCSAHSDHVWVDPEPIRLQPLAAELDSAECVQVWTGAVTAFAARSGISEAVTQQLIAQPRPVSTQTTLDLFASALLLILDHSVGQRRRSDPPHEVTGDPLAGVLDHETTMLASILSASGAQLERGKVQQAMAVAYLTTPTDASDAGAALHSVLALSGVPKDVLARTADALSDVYHDPHGRRWAAPTPDRLPDTHLLRLLDAAHSDADGVVLLDQVTASVPADEAGVVMARLTRALSTPGADRRYPRGLARLRAGAGKLILSRDLPYLMAAIDLDPTGYREPIKRAVDGLSHHDADRVDAQLRRLGFATTRTEIAIWLSERLMTHWNATPHTSANIETTADRADDLAVYATRLSEIGRREEALGPAQEAATTYRRLADANTATYLPKLAMSLNNLGIRLYEIGRHEDALAPAEEAVIICRHLTEAKPSAYLPDLAMSLNHLGIRFSRIGRREEALAATEEAVGIRRRLVEDNPAAFEPDLAMSLNNLGLFLSDMGLPERGLAATQEAVGIRRRLAEANPAAHLPNLAMSLNNLGNRLSEIGRREEGLAPTEEAADIYRRLAEANPAAYLPDLAMSLNNLGNRLSEIGRRQEALAPAEEAVITRRRLAEVNPAVHLHYLAGSLYNLGRRFSDIDRFDEALASVEEALTIYRLLAEANPEAYLPNVAMSSTALGNSLSDVGKREEALAPAQEAVNIQRRLAEANPHAYEPGLAMSLINLGIRFSETGRSGQALTPAEEALTIYRRLVEANPATHLPDLARSLWNIGWICDKSALDPIVGLQASREAVDLFAALADQLPAAFIGRRDAANATLASLLETAGRPDEAARARRRFGSST